MFEAIDTIARVIGYWAMVFGVIWFIERHNREKRDFETRQKERAAQTDHEMTLKRENPEGYLRYRETREKARWEAIQRTGEG